MLNFIIGLLISAGALGGLALTCLVIGWVTMKLKKEDTTDLWWVLVVGAVNIFYGLVATVIIILLCKIGEAALA